jgi:hypothetical protein
MPVAAHRVVDHGRAVQGDRPHAQETYSEAALSQEHAAPA